MSRRSLLALPPLAGLVAVVVATGKGLYVSPDAVFYVGTARNLLDGRGLTPPPGLPPLDHFPPLFTWILAGVGWLGLDPLDAARLVNALALAGIGFVVGTVVLARTGSVPAALVASGLTVAARDLLASSGSALSEPVFVLFALAALAALAAHLDRPRPALLAAATVLAAAAFLTRYVGVAVVVVGVAALGWRRRWAEAAVLGVVGVLPVVLWLAWAGGGDRSLGWHRFGRDYLGQAVRPLTRWIVPWPGPPVGFLLAAAVVVTAVALARRRPAVGRAASLDVVLVAFVAAYLLAVVGNRLFTDASGRLDARFLLPAHVAAVALAVPALWRRRLPAVAGAVLAAQVAGALAWTAGGVTDDSVARRGYTAAAWERSPIVARLAGSDEPVYTNGFDAVFLLTGRSTLPIPAERDYLTGRANPRLADELAAMRANGGLVAYFDALTFRRSFLPSRAELEAALPLEVVLRDDVGTLYRLR